MGLVLLGHRESTSDFNLVLASKKCSLRLQCPKFAFILFTDGIIVMPENRYNLNFYLSVCLSFKHWVTAHGWLGSQKPPINQSIRSSIYLALSWNCCLPVCLPVCLSVCLSVPVCWSIYRYIYLSFSRLSASFSDPFLQLCASSLSSETHTHTHTPLYFSRGNNFLNPACIS